MQPDLLRLEGFGGVYYHRASGTFTFLSTELSELLRAARSASLMDVYAGAPERFGVSELELVELVIGWQRRGVLDERFRCQADLLETAAPRGQLSAPLRVHLQLTRACNLRCPYCFVRTSPTPSPGELDPGHHAELFEELRGMGTPVVILSGGEPLLYPGFWEVVEALGASGLDAALCSNASLIDAEVAKRLAASPLRWYALSLDLPAPGTDEARAPASFERARAGIERLVRAGAPDVQLRVTVTRQNVDRLLDFADLARELGVAGVDLRPFRRTESVDAPLAERLQLTPREYRRGVTAAEETWPADAPPISHRSGDPIPIPGWCGLERRYGCGGGVTSAAVAHDGAVLGCGFIEHEQAWRLPDRSFAECWRSSPALRWWREGGAEAAAAEVSCPARALAHSGDPAGLDPWRAEELLS